MKDWRRDLEMALWLALFIVACGIGATGLIWIMRLLHRMFTYG